MKRFAWVVVALAVGIALATPGAGCGDPPGCKYFCQKEAECCSAQYGCDPDTTDIPACTAACEAQAAKDDTYKSAIEDQASCYEGSTCDEVNSGACIAMP